MHIRKDHIESTVHPVSQDPPKHQIPTPDNTEERNANVVLPVKEGRFAFLLSGRFFLVLFIGQVLAFCIVSTNTFSSLLVEKGTSIPAFQSLFNYILLNVTYTSYTLYRYGFRKWARVVLTDGWKYIILGFLDVEGNYFVVLAYRYTTILSAQLINFWAIIVVVILSFCFLRVRYNVAQITGIIICCGGMGTLIGIDHINGSEIGGQLPTEVKGDLFMLLGATLYGFSNVAEEFLVSKKPLFEVVGQLSFWAMLINGAQAGIFDRASFRSATWDGQVAGYLVGYTISLFIFYTVVPVLLRMASAAFFNISLLTTGFWGTLVGIRVLGLTMPRLYPIAFVMIIIGLIIYFTFQNSLGESWKPWLGLNQEKGVDGVGTAKAMVEAAKGNRTNRV